MVHLAKPAFQTGCHAEDLPALLSLLAVSPVPSLFAELFPRPSLRYLAAGPSSPAALPATGG